MQTTPGGNRSSRERRFRQLQLVRDQGELEVAATIGLLDVSLETVRRDLRALDSQGLMRRSYGRVFAVDSGVFETSLAIRHTINPEEKGRIAAALITKFDEAQTIFIDEV